MMHLLLIYDINVEPTILVEECIVCCLECIVWVKSFVLCAVSSVLHGLVGSFLPIFVLARRVVNRELA